MRAIPGEKVDPKLQAATAAGSGAK
jgi:hypothetical protein